MRIALPQPEDFLVGAIEEDRNRSPSPTTAPISASIGWSGSAAGGGGAAAASTGATTARCGGRREAEKMGRSWVAGRDESGIAESGLPPGCGLTVSAGIGKFGN
jgi:hypothetical protein